jgi:hypothetical protein
MQYTELGAFHGFGDVAHVGAHRPSPGRASTVGPMSVTNQRVTCPGPLVESQPGVGECSRGEACEALAFKDDYLTYRGAHMRVTSEWLERRSED